MAENLQHKSESRILSNLQYQEKTFEIPNFDAVVISYINLQFLTLHTD